MAPFLKKLLLHSVSLLLITGAIVLVRYLNGVHYSTLDFSTLPTNFISNSVCFNAKLEHAKVANRLMRAKLLIIGSSMALNNVSGQGLSAQFNEPIYNMSSWGLKPRETYGILKQIGDSLTIRHLIIPFNNTEFHTDAKSIDYDGVHEYLFGENALEKVRNYFTNFTLNGFVKDWSFRTNFIHCSNVNYSLNFDDRGSIMLRPQRFIFDPAARRLAYHDTTGFRRFVADVDSVSRFCRQRNIRLTLVYLPWRRDVLTADKDRQVRFVADYMAARYPGSFINLSELAIDNRHYIDAGHMFEGGAAVVTKALVDSLSARNTAPRQLALHTPAQQPY